MKMKTKFVLLAALALTLIGAGINAWPTVARARCSAPSAGLL